VKDIPMIACHDEMIEQIAQSIFATMFSLELVRTEDADFVHQNPLVASIFISGEWTGCVQVAMSPSFAQVASANMLGLDRAAVTIADEQEVAAEITNMIGGNLKGLLTSPSSLSLPTITPTSNVDEFVRNGRLVHSVTLSCETGQIRIGMYERA
jgi:CheY-specific phosphatase CheX